MSKFNVRFLSEIAFMATLSFIISLIPTIRIAWIGIEIACIPILLLSLRKGVGPGALAALIWGFLEIVTGQAYFLSLSQSLLEYIIAPITLGIAGLFHQKSNNLKLFPIISGTLFAILAKYFIHFIAGIIFWSKYAWEGWGAVTYSLVINGLSALLTLFVIIAIFTIFFRKFPSIFHPKN